jgi:FkbM family methyltransferase
VGLLKEMARLPWNLSKPIRERLVFRLLHYGRALLRPLESGVGALESRVGALESRVAALQSGVDALPSRTAALESRVAALTEQVGEMRASTDASLPELRGAIGLVQRTSDELVTRIGDVERRVDSSLDRAAQGLVRQAELLNAALEALFRDVNRARAGASNPSFGTGDPGERSPDLPHLLAFLNNPGAIVSYAQNREDVLLARLFPRDYQGFYVDVGAGDPTELSVSRLFYDRGWHGINIEPSRILFDRLVESRPRDVNLNVGAWDSDGELEFFECENGAGRSSFFEQEALGAERLGIRTHRRVVTVRRLDQVLTAYAPAMVDFLKIDVEGAEARVLRGVSWSRFRPRVVVIEARPERARPADAASWVEESESLLTDAGYLFATFDGLNRFYVRAEDAAWVEVLRVPPNVFDSFVPFEIVAGLADHYERLKALESELRAATTTLDRAATTAGQLVDPSRGAAEAPEPPAGSTGSAKAGG